MTTGQNIVLFSILLLGFIFLSRHYRVQLKNKWGIGLVVVMYGFLLFGISFLGSLIRIYVFSHVGLDLTSLFPLILSVGGGQALPLPAPSDTGSSSPYSEDPLDIDVLLEPFSETESGFTSTNSSRTVRSPGDGPSVAPDQERQRQQEAPLLLYILLCLITPRFVNNESQVFWPIRPIETNCCSSNKNLPNILLYCKQASTRALFPEMDFDSLNYGELVKSMLKDTPFSIQYQEDLDEVSKMDSKVKGEFHSFLNKKFQT